MKYLNEWRKWARLVVTCFGILLFIGVTGWYLGFFLADVAHYKMVRGK